MHLNCSPRLAAGHFWRADIHQYRAGAAFERGDLETIEREYVPAERLAGENPEMRYWHAIALLTLGKSDDGIAILSEIAALDRNWIELTLRLPSMKWLDPSITERIRKLLK